MEQSKFYQIKNVTEHEYTLVGCDGSVITRPIQDIDKSASAFTIKDAKPGDVLVTDDMIVLFKNRLENDSILTYFQYDAIDDEFEPGSHLYYAHIYPATKEQCDTFFSKMKDAGYEFDFESKELNKIEPTPTWSEEDEYTLGETIQHLEELIRIEKVKHCGIDVQYYQRDIDWLKSLKDRIQSQNTWKPSDVQMKLLKEACDQHWEPDVPDPLYTLYQDLKKLKE